MKKKTKKIKKALKVQKGTKKIKKVSKVTKRTKKPKKTKKSKNVKKAFLSVSKIGQDLKSLKKSIFELKEELRRYISPIFNFGQMNSHQAKVSVLMVGIIFAGLLAAFGQYEYNKSSKLEKIPEVVKSAEEIRKEALEKKIMSMVQGSPIEKMVPYIAEKDEKTAAFLIGIAKKESNWGKRKPVLAGVDCFNYWGFRQVRERMGSGGHTCFENPKDAVDTVAKRVSQIIENNEVESAKEMIVWKCGYSCATHSDESVRKWISDVDMYAGKILN